MILFFMGRDHGKVRNHSEEKAKEIDNEIHFFIDKAYEKARQIIKKKMDYLHAMAQALLDFETIDSEEVSMIMQGKSLSDLKNYRKELSEKLKEERESYEKEEVKKKKTSDKHVGSTIPSPV